MSLQRSSNATIKNIEKNSTEKKLFDFNFGYEILKRINSKFKAKEIKSNNLPVTSPYKEDTNEYLAYNHPMRFIAKYLNSEVINNSIKRNPAIIKIALENNLNTNYNLDNVKNITLSHLIPTAKRAIKIYEKIGHLKSEKNYIYLLQAALLHDIGKIFIPEEILNKKGKLNPKERKIIELHNRFSYEILIGTDLNPKVAQLAYEHHNYDKRLVKNQENQALMIADIFSALRESRSYKKSMSALRAKTILYDIGTKGEIDTRYIRYVD